MKNAVIDTQLNFCAKLFFSLINFCLKKACTKDKCYLFALHKMVSKICMVYYIMVQPKNYFYSFYPV